MESSNRQVNKGFESSSLNGSFTSEAPSQAEHAMPLENKDYNSLKDVSSLISMLQDLRSNLRSLPFLQAAELLRKTSVPHLRLEKIDKESLNHFIRNEYDKLIMLLNDQKTKLVGNIPTNMYYVNERHSISKSLAPISKGVYCQIQEMNSFMKSLLAHIDSI